jgi:dynein heavy chain
VNVPHYVAKLIGKREELRIMRENVMLIVRDYNTIIHTINEQEKSLFKEHLEMLDQPIEKGIKKLNWEKSDDKFMMHCRKECQDVFKKVKMF